MRRSTARNVSADELDFVQINRELVELAVEALENAKKADLRVEYLAGGFVTYTPEQKCAALDLDAELIENMAPSVLR